MENNNNSSWRDKLVQTFIEVDALNVDQFLQVKETLTRIGIANKNNKTLTQTCHVLQKKGRYFIVHFLELFALDGRDVDITQADLERRNAIALLLHKWNMCKIKDSSISESKYKSVFYVLKYDEKHTWELRQNYEIGA